MRIVLSALLLATTSMLSFAQEKSAPLPILPLNVFTTTATAIDPGVAPFALAPADPFLAMRIPLNSKIYIAPFKSKDASKPVQGFGSYMAAALRKEGVPVIMVADRSQADFEIAGSAGKRGAGFAKKWPVGNSRRSTSASLTVTNLNTGVIAYADSSHRSSANSGLRLSTEQLAKYLKRKMMDDHKTFVRMAPLAAKR